MPTCWLCDLVILDDHVAMMGMQHRDTGMIMVVPVHVRCGLADEQMREVIFKRLAEAGEDIPDQYTQTDLLN